MDDEGPKKRDWAVVFLFRLCLIGWMCSILYETLHRVPTLRPACLFVGAWACVIAVLNGIAFLLMRRQGIFLIFVLIMIPPTIHFGLIWRNVAIDKKWLESSPSKDNAGADENETVSPRKPTR